MQMLKNFIDKINVINANLIYFICIFIALVINIFAYYQSNLRDFVEILGTFIQISLPCYALVPVLAKKDLQGAKQMLLLLAIVLVITYILKVTVPIKRPYGGSMSFPSGHTAGAFSGAVFLSYRYGKIYALYSMPLAFFVAFSRLYSHNHWPTDVVASMAICFITGVFIVKKYRIQTTDL